MENEKKNIVDIVEGYILSDRMEKNGKSEKEKFRVDILDEAKSKSVNDSMVELEGKTGNVKVVFAESLNINPNDAFIEAYNSGLYPYVVKTARIDVIPENMEVVLKALDDAGIRNKVSVVESYAFNKKTKLASGQMDEVLKSAVVVQKSERITVINKE